MGLGALEAMRHGAIPSGALLLGQTTPLGPVTMGERRGSGIAQGNDFWSASRLILQQCFTLLKPGAHAVFVLKGFVRAGKLVDFPISGKRCVSPWGL